MIRFIIVRFLQTVVAFFGIIVIVFFLLRVSGNPADLMRTPITTEAALAQLKHNFGLDRSNMVQFWIFVKGAVHFDFGQSYLKNRPSLQIIGEALPNTLRIGIPSFGIGLIISVILGVMAAIKRDSWFDNGMKFIVILGQALPGFWVGIMAMLIFSLYWPILPSGGLHGWDLKYYVLPVGTMLFFMLPGMMRLMRSSMLDTLDSEYVKLARIKGLPESRVIWKHAFRNAIISPMTVAGMILAGLIGGAVITESIFVIPGMGRLMVQSTFGRDFPVVQACAVLVAVGVLGANFLVDIAYAWVDPQIRYEKS
jgi:ABC-type dipeptide/oligopeptide/nickel transport system permease component